MSVRQRRDRAAADNTKKKWGLFGAKKKELHKEIQKDPQAEASADPKETAALPAVAQPVEEELPSTPQVKRILNPLVDNEEELNFLDEPDDEEDFLDEPDPEESDENIDDDDEFDDDDDDVDVNQLLAEKEAYLALKREKRELRRQKRRDFFTKVKNFSVKDLWSRRGEAKDYILDKINRLKNFRLEKKEKGELKGEGLDLNARIKIEQNKNRIRIAAIGTVVVVVLAGLGIYFHMRVFHTMKVITVQQRQDDNATEYVPLKRYRLKCNPNGVTCVNKKNEVVWNTTFTMQSPIVDKCGDLVAVGSHRGNEIYIFNDEGLVSNFTVEHVLTKMKITKQGDVAVILEDGQLTWINVYDKWGKLLIRNRTSMPESGYPMDMDISGNGYKMMVSFLGVDEDIESRVTFYNFSAVGQDSEGKLVNQEVYSGHVVPEVKFMEGSYAVAFMDNGVSVFRGQQIPEQCNEIMIDQEIFSQFSNDQYFGFVTESDEEIGEHKYKIVIYRENGSKCGTIYTNFEYTSIVMSDNQVILYNNTSMRIYNVKGKLVFSGDYDKEILKVVPTSSSRKFNILTDDSVDLIKIK